jgi:hypothetical protein
MVKCLTKWNPPASAVDGVPVDAAVFGVVRFIAQAAGAFGAAMDGIGRTDAGIPSRSYSRPLKACAIGIAKTLLQELRVIRYSCCDGNFMQKRYSPI